VTQLFDVLDPATLAGLRDSVRRLGVLVPVAKDQHGNILDGHHRVQVADDLGVRYRVDVIQVADDEQADEIRRTLNVDRRQLSGDELKRHILVLAQLREPSGVGSLSQQEIADRTGASQATVSRVLATHSLNELPTARRGQDGKVRTSSRPAMVTARNEREAERARAALALAPDMGGRTVDVKRAERVAREHVANLRREEPLEYAAVNGFVDIRHGDFRQSLAGIPDGTVDAVITDPPYPSEFWPLLADLGQLAARILKPNGVLAVMTGTRLPMVDYAEDAIGRHLRRRHRGVYLVPGQRWRDQLERVATGWKPILLFSRRDADDLPWVNDDIFRSDESRQDDRFHHWGQSESGFASIVGRLTAAGQLVVDPFVGGGTAAVVCRDLGRRFIGCDVDAHAVRTTRERLA
jgi:ParB-like chromosome segregation protein Spo0J